MNEPVELKLFHGQSLVGTIRKIFPDGLWHGGDLELTQSGQTYRKMFDFMTAEENVGKDPPVEESMMESWSIEEPDGTRQKIGTPIVHDGNEIYFRFI